MKHDLTDMELAKNATFLVWLKTASYAPPDLTGDLEGRFAAPLETVVEAITALIENEMKTGYAYRYYANNLRDFSHHSIAEEFEDHADEETEHAEFLMRRLAVLVGAVQLPDIPAPPPVSSPEEVIATMIRIEQEGIAKWRLLRSLIGDDNPMRFKIEEYMTREQHHLDELWQLMPRTPQVKQAFIRGYGPATLVHEDTADLTPEAIHDNIARLRKEERDLRMGSGAATGGLVGYLGSLAALKATEPTVMAPTDRLNGRVDFSKPLGTAARAAIQLGGTALGTAAGMAIPYVSHKVWNKHYDDLRAEEAPPAPGHEMRLVMDQGGSLVPGLAAQTVGLAGATYGTVSRDPGLTVAGTALMAAPMLSRQADVSRSVRKLLEQVHHQRHVLHHKATVPPEDVPPVEAPKTASLGFPSTPIPTSLTPSQSAMDSTYRPMVGPSSPAPPTEIFPEQLDPRLVSELKNEEAARVQESEAASAYFQGQLQNQRMESEQLQQQLQQLQEQLEQASQQLEQVNAEKQQVEQMAQQAADTATGALQSQLQAQQDALQSRQTATQALTFSDQLRQRVRELADPPPAPPPPMQQPAPPVGQDPNAPTPPPPPQEADPNAPKTASVAETAARSAGRVFGESVAPASLAIHIGIPLLAGTASAMTAFHQNKNHGADMLEKARAATQKAREMHEQNPSYRNALGLTSARTKEMGIELAVKYPRNTAMAAGTGGAAAARGAIEAIQRISAHLRDAANVRANSRI